jgi:hypothetical protein
MPDTAKPDTAAAAAAQPPSGRAPRPARYATAAYATVVYACFVAVFAYAVGFFANAVVPRSIDHGPGSSWPLAAGTDLLLLALFAAQHTVMARPWFKRAWTRLVPEPAERATFVLATSLALAVLFWQWRPVRGTVWQLSGSGAAAVLAVYAAGCSCWPPPSRSAMPTCSGCGRASRPPGACPTPNRRSPSGACTAGSATR